MKTENKIKEKPVMMRGVLTVKEKVFLSPHYIRIILEGNDLYKFKEANIGDNNKLIIPKEQNAEVVLPDLKQGKNRDENTSVRTYTLRNLDLEKGEMAIDFVMHGETGPASKWAMHAEKGNQLGVLMKSKRKPLFQPADWFLLAGDHTAVPVISAILEKLPSKARGNVILEVYDAEDTLELQKPMGVTITWTFNKTPGENSTLVNFLKTIDLSKESSKFIFAAAEYHAIKEIQQLLRKEDNLARKDWYAFSYWKYGQAEDASASVRRGLSK